MGKRVLITGKDSYIGTMYCEYTTEYGDVVDTVDTISDEWKNTDFSAFDAVVHVAAIVHKQKRKITQDEYFEINTNLAFDVAKKAKESGVKQFVFLSTMSVYGVVNGEIGKDTKLQPFNMYGESKKQAEIKLQQLCDDNFTVTIVRPPVVYGKGCKGNYVELARYAKNMPVFPDYESQRSMLYIDNLSAFIKKAIDEQLGGVFCPQDKEYVRTTDMVVAVAKANGKKMRLTKVFNPLIRLCIKMKVNLVCKVFGSLTYDKDLCPDYDRVDFDTAIKFTEQK